jgi:hypothetical protein
MRQRRWVLVAGILLAAVAAYSGIWPQHQRPAGPPFVPLDTALEGYLKNGWSILVPPKLEGPYRIVQKEHPIVFRNSDKKMNYRVRGPEGAEEVHLDGSADYDQILLELETQNGRQTLVVLKRSG